MIKKDNWNSLLLSGRSFVFAVAVDGPKLKRCGLFFRQSFKVVPEQVAMSPVRSLLLGLRDEVDDNYKSKTWWTRTTTTAGTP